MSIAKNNHKCYTYIQKGLLMIRKLRKEHNMRLQDLADMLGITAIQLSRIERGTRGLKIAYAKKLGEIFDVEWPLFYSN